MFSNVWSSYMTDLRIYSPISPPASKAQCSILKELESFLTEEEQDIVRRGRNANPHSTAKNADIVEYKYATGFEALIGFLHLSEQKERLNEILNKCVEIVSK